MSNDRCASPTTTDREAARPARGFLTRLRRAEAGNVLPMMAMAFVPIAGMVGSGLDMSRAYLTKAKLQTACDSTALATRRFMGGSPITEEAKAEGRKFFAFNFPDGVMGSARVVPIIGVNQSQTDVVEVRASTTVSTSLMRIFGKESIAVSVSCNADQDFVHNDIMLVLDVTGSMNCTVGTSCLYQENEQPDSRIDALREASTALYDSLAVADAGIRIRYGIMPYSMSVNVSRDLNTNWVRTLRTGTPQPTTAQSGSRYWRSPNGRTDNYALTYVNNTTAFMTSWRSNAAADIQRGCIEERSTIGATGADINNIRINGNVSRADIDSVSTTDNLLRWHPYNPESTGNTQQVTSAAGFPAKLQAFCPTRARQLAEYDASAFDTEIARATSRVGGYTNHDLGMMWGARYISPTGMFAANNLNVVTQMRVQRHIVFMTDGDMTSTGINYSAYGMPNYQNRWSTSGTSDTQLPAKHATRFRNACAAAKGLGTAENRMTIWVVAVDVPTAGLADLQSCASGSGHFFQARSADELKDAFDTIGKEIGKLRLTK